MARFSLELRDLEAATAWKPWAWYPRLNGPVPRPWCTSYPPTRRLHSVGYWGQPRSLPLDLEWTRWKWPGPCQTLVGPRSRLKRPVRLSSCVLACSLLRRPTCSVPWPLRSTQKHRIGRTTPENPHRTDLTSLHMHGEPKKPDCFLDEITLQRLLTEKRVIRQKFQNFV